MAERIIYLYGIVPASLSLEGAPTGLDDGRLELVRKGDIAALVSRLDASAYPVEVVEANVGNVAWVGPRAVAHDQVLTWASEAGAVVPLPMFTLYREASALDQMLAERGEKLRRTIARIGDAQEYAVRLFRLDDVLSSRLVELSPKLAELDRAAQAATPGQRYLLERKAETE
ncbi:MAG TPA: GvpL/GvpF family gas vesicle protein, partial [Gemmatimonadaceae bacterium]|nr:GvpL/GvpF family gas vesicle protein [Gemmatimonadaceae bacterium]